MQYLFDEKGRRYLDALAGISTCNVGHAHPKLVEAGQKQLEALPHATTVYCNDQHAQYVYELAQRLPKELGNVYLVNSGSEANDLAILHARLFTGNHTVLTLRHAYHGMAGITADLTSMGTWRYPVPNVNGIEKVIPPYLYRMKYKRMEDYVDEIKEVINTNTTGKIAAFVAESMMGAGGFVDLPQGYLKEAYKIARNAGGVCIADEVQTGFGRTGSMWGFTKHGVVPDIAVFAKAIGGGAPLAAVVTRPEIAEKMKQKIHFNTFGGNPFSCAMGRAVLRIID